VRCTRATADGRQRCSGRVPVYVSRFAGGVKYALPVPLPPLPIPFGLIERGLTMRRRALELVDRSYPAEGVLWDLVAGLQRTKLAGALVDTGIADALGERSRTPVEVARELGLDVDVTSRVLLAAAAARLASVDHGGRVRLSRIGAPLRRDHPNTIASWVSYAAAPANARGYEQLVDQIREGAEPSGHRRAFGDSVWEHFEKHPDEGARFARAMREMTAVDVAALARAYPWPRRGVICDVAGGIGTLLAEILARRARARGILVEENAVLAEAERYLDDRGVNARVERIPGDLFGELKAQADVYVLKWILHDWNDDACVQMLHNIRATMPPGAKVVSIDQRLKPTFANPVTNMVDLHMLVECEGGRERTPQQVHRLMAEVGLKPGKVRHAGFHMLVEGKA
jgi:O-methyltransferase